MNVKQKSDKYLKVVKWAIKRYADNDRWVDIKTGDCLSIYSRIENLAWNKYMARAPRPTNLKGERDE